jgi:hypothetical protein
LYASLISPRSAVPIILISFVITGSTTPRSVALSWSQRSVRHALPHVLNYEFRAR